MATHKTVLETCESTHCFIVALTSSHTESSVSLFVDDLSNSMPNKLLKTVGTFNDIKRKQKENTGKTSTTLLISK